MSSKSIEKSIIDKSISGAVTTNAASIRPNAFRGCQGITSITLTAATSVDGSAFWGCTGLTAVECDELTSIDSWGEGAVFSSLYFPKVTSIYGANSVGISVGVITTLPDSAFPELTSLSGSSGVGGAAIKSDSLTSAAFLKLSTATAQAFTCPNLTDVTTQATNISFSLPLTIKVHLTNAVTSMNSSVGCFDFAHTASDPVLFSMTNWPTAGTQKSTKAYTIYTDNQTIKDGCLAKADSYTTVNVYHRDGSSW